MVLWECKNGYFIIGAFTPEERFRWCKYMLFSVFAPQERNFSSGMHFGRTTLAPSLEQGLIQKKGTTSDTSVDWLNACHRTVF